MYFVIACALYAIRRNQCNKSDRSVAFLMATEISIFNKRIVVQCLSLYWTSIERRRFFWFVLCRTTQSIASETCGSAPRDVTTAGWKPDDPKALYYNTHIEKKAFFYKYACVYMWYIIYMCMRICIITTVIYNV